MNYDILLLVPIMAIPVYLFWDLVKHIKSTNELFEDPTHRQFED